MIIRYGNTGDAKMLSELGAKTFYDAFTKDNSLENMKIYLKNSFSPEIQLKELSAPDNIFLIAESEGIPAGYAQLILNSTDETVSAGRPMELRRIYALQEYLGRGIGRELMKRCIDEARERDCDVIWLGVWEKNQRAIDFYKKWGFRQAGSHLFSLGFEPQNDLIMMLDLTRPSM